MPLLNRETLVDRPVLVNRGDEEDEQDTKESEESTVEMLGQGGGPTLHGLQFEPGDYNVVAGANTAAVLATGEQGGEAFEASFVNAAIQLRDLTREGEDIRDLARFGLEKGVAELGLSMKQIDTLREVPQEAPEPDEEVDADDEVEEIEDEPETDSESEEDDDSEEEDSNIEDVEGEIEDMKDEEEDTDSE